MLVKVNPFRSLLNHDTLFDDFFTVDYPAVARSFEPRIDVRETEKEFVVTAELPGLNKDDFKLTIEDNILTLEGEKKFEREEKKDNYYRAERSYGAFKRAFRLTDSVDSKKIKADYTNGVLEITLPKAAKVKPKEIAINVK
ncbi:MAG: Hsp20/alpha crystallin family protein [bacterium]